MLRAALLDDRGQGLAEYGLILGFVAVLCVIAISYVGQQTLDEYRNVGANYP